MATKAAEARVLRERANAKKSTTAKKRAKKAALAKSRVHSDSGESGHANRKATVVMEDSAKRPSRKSTRKASNRSKSASTLEIRENLTKNSPQRRHERRS